MTKCHKNLRISKVSGSKNSKKIAIQTVKKLNIRNGADIVLNKIPINIKAHCLKFLLCFISFLVCVFLLRRILKIILNFYFFAVKLVSVKYSCIKVATNTI